MGNSRIVNIQNARPASHGKTENKEILSKMKHMIEAYHLIISFVNDSSQPF